MYLPKEIKELIMQYKTSHEEYLQKKKILHEILQPQYLFSEIDILHMVSQLITRSPCDHHPMRS